MCEVISVSQVRIGDSVWYSGGYRTVTKVAEYRGRMYLWGRGGTGFLGTQFPEQPLVAIEARHNMTRKVQK